MGGAGRASTELSHVHIGCRTGRIAEESGHVAALEAREEAGGGAVAMGGAEPEPAAEVNFDNAFDPQHVVGMDALILEAANLMLEDADADEQGFAQQMQANLGPQTASKQPSDASIQAIERVKARILQTCGDGANNMSNSDVLALMLNRHVKLQLADAEKAYRASGAGGEPRPPEPVDAQGRKLLELSAVYVAADQRLRDKFLETLSEVGQEAVEGMLASAATAAPIGGLGGSPQRRTRFEMITWMFGSRILSYGSFFEVFETIGLDLK